MSVTCLVLPGLSFLSIYMFMPYLYHPFSFSLINTIMRSIQYNAQQDEDYQRSPLLLLPLSFSVRVFYIFLCLNNFFAVAIVTL